jgi:hypothetical protein
LFGTLAYTGNYTPAQHSILLDSSAIDPESSPPKVRTHHASTTDSFPPPAPGGPVEAFDDSVSFPKRDKKKNKTPVFGFGFGAEKSCSYCGHTTGEEPLSRKQIL